MSGSNIMFFPRSCSCGLHKLPLMNLLFITDNVSSQLTEFLLVAILVLFISQYFFVPIVASRKRLVILLRNANPFLGSKYLQSSLFLFSFQLLGIALRSDIPLALDLLPSFWKCLLNLPLDPDRDLKESDILTYNYLRRFSEVRPRCTCE